jgi:hypothetical protein
MSTQTVLLLASPDDLERQGLRVLRAMAADIGGDMPMQALITLSKAPSKALLVWEAYGGEGPYPPWPDDVPWDFDPELEKAREWEGRRGHWVTMRGRHVFVYNNEWIPRKNKMDRHERSGGQGQGMKWARHERRLAIYHRDGMACAWCGSKPDKKGSQLTLDHLIDFQQEDGSHHHDNLVTCCHDCNTHRNNRTVHAFAKVVAKKIDHGITDNDILGHIRACVERPLDMKEGREPMSVHGTWEKAMAHASKPKPHIIARRGKHHARMKGPLIW